MPSRLYFGLRARIAPTRLLNSTWGRRPYTMLPRLGQASRSVSFQAIPRAAFKVFRTSAVAGTVGISALAYANHQVDNLTQAAKDKLNALGEWGSATFDAVGEGLSSAYDGVSGAAEKGKEGLGSTFSSISAWSSDTAQGLRDWMKSKTSSDDEFQNEQYENPYESQSNSNGGNNGHNGPAAVVTAAAAVASLPTSDDPTNDLMLLTRKLIEVRSILLSIDHGESLQLPSIVVIGSQSSGKSSVLEAIVGHEFLPKGNNMVTRRPIELTLIHTPRTTKNPDPTEFAEFPLEHSGHITDFSVVQQRLTDLNLAVSAAEAVSPDPIQLRIHSPNVPDLSLVDLPGYVQISSMDQPEELKHKIVNLCDKYIRANNIILAVCSADVDLANSPALRASRKVDPLGLRTIGVITKMDLVDPQVGSDVLANERYPLALGYVGVVCKAVAQKEKEHQEKSSSLFRFGAAESANFDLQKPVQRQENAFFGSNAEHFNRPGMLVGTNTLKRRLMEVLEESMGGSLHSISNAVALELEEASYQFKVQYNDRSISAESYFAETMDSLKVKFASLSKVFGKPEARMMLRAAIEEKVTDTLAKMYWIDPKLPELSKLAADTRAVPTPEDLEPYWQHKLEASASAVTKSGIGRSSTQLIVDALRNQVAKLAEMEPFIYHPAAAEGITALSDAILHNRFAATAEQVENSVKPFKKEVEVDENQWEAGRQRGQALLERELGQCDGAFKKISEVVGNRKLKGAMDFVRDLEERERRRIARRSSAIRNADALPEIEDEDNDPNRPVYNPNLLAKAREAAFLKDRSDVLKLRIAALKAKRCRSGPENQAFCPEAFLNAVAAQLTYTAIQHINIELLGEFFYLFPREIDSRYDLHKQEITDFARQNPDIRKHLDLQERKEKLELVMGKLDSLVKLQQEKQGGRRPQERRGLFGGILR